MKKTIFTWMKCKKIIGYVLSICAILQMIIILAIFFSAEKHQEIVKCYDKNNNEIIGLTCYDEVYSDGELGQLQLYDYVPVSVILGILGLMCLFLKDMIKEVNEQ